MEGRASNGQFLPGHKFAKGRPKSSRHRVSEQFLQDYLTVWEERGIDSLRELSHAEFVKLAPQILPKDFQLTVQDEGKARWVIYANHADQQLTAEEWLEQAIPQIEAAQDRRKEIVDPGGVLPDSGQR